MSRLKDIRLKALEKARAVKAATSKRYSNMRNDPKLKKSRSNFYASIRNTAKKRQNPKYAYKPLFRPRNKIVRSTSRPRVVQVGRNQYIMIPKSKSKRSNRYHQRDNVMTAFDSAWGY